MAAKGCEDFFAIGYKIFFLRNGIFHDDDALLRQVFNSVFSNQDSNKRPFIAPSYCKGQLSYRCIEQLYQIYIFPMALVVFILQCALHLFILKLIIAEAVETVRKAYQPFA